MSEDAPKILILSGDDVVRESFHLHFEGLGWAVRDVDTAEKDLERVRQSPTLTWCASFVVALLCISHWNHYFFVHRCLIRFLQNRSATCVVWLSRWSNTFSFAKNRI